MHSGSSPDVTHLASADRHTLPSRLHDENAASHDNADFEADSSDEEYQYSVLLPDEMKNISLEHQYPNRFIGKSSGVNLYRTALDLKSEYAGEAYDHEPWNTRRPEYWSVLPVSSLVLAFQNGCSLRRTAVRASCS